MKKKMFVVCLVVSMFSVYGILGNSARASYLGVSDWTAGTGSNVDTTLPELKLPGLVLLESGRYFFDDFEANEDGVLPAGWSTINPGNANWRVKWDNENTSLVVGHPDGQYIPDCSNLVVNGLTLGDVVMVSKIKVQEWGGKDESRCGVGAYINSEGKGYIATLHQSHPWEPWKSDFKAVQMLNDGEAWGADGRGESTADQWDTGPWYYIKLKVEGNNQWEKVWRVGQPEPETWPRQQTWGGREPGSVGLRAMTGDNGTGIYWFDEVAVYKTSPLKVTNVSAGWQVSLCDGDNVKATQTVAEGESEVSLEVTDVSLPSAYQIKVFDGEENRISLHSLSNIFGGDEYRWGGAGGYQGSGRWTSNAIDSKIDGNDWGSISWTANIPSGTSMLFRTRTKNHEGDLWSEWSEYAEPGEITSPDGRYIQCQVELASAVDNATPSLSEIQLTYYTEGVEAGAISGNVKSGGSPLADATVRASQDGIARGTAQTDANGNYTIANLEPGTYKVTVAAPGYQLEAEDAVVVEGGEVTTVDFSLVLQEGLFTFVAVYPASEDTPSRIMQGGKLFRYYRLVDNDESPVIGAVVKLTDGSEAVTDEQGLAELAYQGSETKEIGTYQLAPVRMVKLNGSEVVTTNLPSFSLEVVGRECQRKWELGGGIDGTYAFIKGEAGGGTYIGLRSLSDKTEGTDVFMIGRGANLGIGVGVGVGWSAGVWKLSVDAGASADAKIIPVGEDNYTFGKPYFESPYSDDAKSAQTAVLLDAFSVTRLIDTPVLGWLIDLLTSPEMEERIEASRDHWGIGIGAKASGQAGVGCGLLHLGPLINVDLPKADVEVMAMIRNIGYDKFPAQPEVKKGINVETYSSFNLDLLKAKLIGLDEWSLDRILFPGSEGHFINATFMQEMFYDANGKAVRFDLGVNRGDRSELTVFTVSDAGAMERIAANSGGTMWQMVGWALNPANLIVSNEQAMKDFANTLNTLATENVDVPYKQVREEISTSEFPVNLNFGVGVNFGLGGKVSYKKYYKFTKEEGAAQGAALYKTAEYNRDEYLDSSDKDIALLFLNIFAGVGPLVRDSLPFNWTVLDWGADKWVQGVDGLAKLYVSAGTLVSGAKVYLAQVPLIGSWIGAPAALTPARMVLAPGAEGSGIVGKIQLVNLYDEEGNIVEQVSQDMELELDYAQVDPSIDTSKLTVFHWDEENGCWQLMPTVNMVSAQKVKAKIRSAGMYAMGQDAVKPTIKFISPQDGDFASLNPTIEVQIEDDFTSVAYQTVRIEINDVNIVDASNVATSSLAGSSERRLCLAAPVLNEGIVKPGENTLVVEVRDSMGNRAIESIKFYVESEKLDVKSVVTCPNPMHDDTNFTWNVSKSGTAEIKIYTLSGKLVKTIREIESKVGYNQVPWDGKNNAGEEIASGIYIYVLKITDVDGNTQVIRDKLAVIE